jgi:hypothetical protein
LGTHLPLSQVSFAFGQSWRRSHCTQVAFRQNGVPASPQSEFVLHCTQRPARSSCVEQIGLFGTAVQSVFEAHWMHRPLAVLHFGVFGVAAQAVSLVHPGTHWPSKLQTWSALQSAFTRHWTHWNAGTLHFGFAAGQSVFLSQATHRLVVESQTGAIGGQSVALLHPTHAPVVALQIGVRMVNAHFVPPSTLQLTWQR